MALLDMLYEKGCSIVAAHVNYHKRETSDRDEKIVKEYCQDKAILVETLEPKYDGKSNFQSWARKARYDFFFSLAKKHQTDTIYVAHQLDDHIETYLLQRKRNMLCDHYGLKNKNKMQGCLIVRPLLDKTKAWLMEYCDQRQIPYGIDESNLSDDYTRNQIRHQIIEKMTLKEKEEFNEKISQENIKLMQKRKKAECFLSKWDKTICRLLLEEEAWFILEYYLHSITGHHYSKKHMLSLLEQLRSDCILELDGYYLESYEGLFYIKKKTDIPDLVISKLEYMKNDHFCLSNTGKTIESITVTKADFPLVIRRIKAGDRIRLRYGTKKVSRFLIDRKIPKIYRKDWLVIENSAKKVIFVPGIGCDVEHFSIKPNLFMVQYLT